MSNDRLPAVRGDQRIARKDVPEAGVVKTKAVEISPSPATSAAGQIVKAVVSAALDWFDQRRTLQSGAIDPRVGGATQTQPRYSRQSFLRISGRMRDRLTSTGDKGHFGLQKRRRNQRCKSVNRGIRKHKKRVR